MRRLEVGDAPFALKLLNEPSFLRYIGDKGVRTLEDAQQYILEGPVASYEKNGFGLYLVQTKDSGLPIGMCGLVKRDALPDPDIGFALLPEFWKSGYAYEAAFAVMEYGKNVLRLTRIVAIANVDNHASSRLLEKLGLKVAQKFRLSAEAAELNLFVPIAETQSSPDMRILNMRS